MVKSRHRSKHYSFEAYRAPSLPNDDLMRIMERQLGMSGRSQRCFPDVTTIPPLRNGHPANCTAMTRNPRVKECSWSPRYALPTCWDMLNITTDIPVSVEYTRCSGCVQQALLRCHSMLTSQKISTDEVSIETQYMSDEHCNCSYARALSKYHSGPASTQWHILYQYIPPRQS